MRVGDADSEGSWVAADSGDWWLEDQRRQRLHPGRQLNTPVAVVVPPPWRRAVDPYWRLLAGGGLRRNVWVAAGGDCLRKGGREPMVVLQRGGPLILVVVEAQTGILPCWNLTVHCFFRLEVWNWFRFHSLWITSILESTEMIMLVHRLLIITSLAVE